MFFLRKHPFFQISLPFFSLDKSPEMQDFRDMQSDRDFFERKALGKIGFPPGNKKK